VPRGTVVSLEHVWRLAGPWYANRLDENWRPRSAEEVMRLFAEAGLTGDFWRVRESTIKDTRHL